MDDFDLIYDEIIESGTDCIFNEVASEGEEILNKKSLDIYNMYENSKSNRHDRGLPDSFGSIAIINTNRMITESGAEISITNDAEGELFDSGSFLDEIIESGDGYQFSREPVSARPIYEPAMREIEEIKLVERLLENKLKQKGYDFE